MLAKCLSILRITTQRSTDDEVARQVAIHKLQVNKRSEKAFAFGQKFNACAGAALLALTHRLDQTMNKAAVLAMCSDSDNTVLGMDRALFDTMRRIYDSESITEDKIKRAVADVSRMSTKPRVDAGLAGCFNELAGRLATVRRMMEIYKAFRGVDLAKRRDCDFPVDLVLRMPMRYQSGISGTVAPHLLPTFQQHTYDLATDLRETHMRQNQGSSAVDVQLLERIVQAATDKGTRVDVDIQQALQLDFGVGDSQLGAFTSDGGLHGVPRANWVAAIGRGGGDTRVQGQGRGSHGMHGVQGQGRGMPGRGLGRGGGPPRGQLNTYSEVKVRVGPVPVDWSYNRVKDALFQVAQVDVAYAGQTAADGTVVVSYRDGASAEAAVRALAGRTLVSGGPAISASVVTQTATANRAQV